MRVLAVLGAVLSAGIASPCLAQNADYVQRYIEAELYPPLQAYIACADRHVRQRATADPHSTFDEQEVTIRPACGHWIETVRAGLLRIGWDAARINLEIRIFYDRVRPQLRTAFNEDSQRRLTTVSREEREEADYLEKVRQEVDKDLTQEHATCIRGAMRKIVPYSAEPAETLVKAIINLCMDYEQKRVKLLAVLYGVPREQAERIVNEGLDFLRRKLLAEIVTFRAALAMAAAAGSEPAEAGSHETGKATTELCQ
jgi:hypothetical protein